MGLQNARLEDRDAATLDGNPSFGAGLGAVWGEQLALRMLGEAGFSDVDIRRVDGDVVNNYYVCKSG